MITVNNINGKPESVPENYKGVHSDDNKFYFFESTQEHEEFTKQSPLIEETCGLKKYQVNQATTIEEINAITFEL